MYRLQSLAAFAIIAAGIGGATPAQANNNMVVGNAILIQQDVEGAFNDQDWAQTSKGDDVFEAEFIRTQVNSRANFALLDGSTIGLGATAIMKIDHVVFDPHNHSIQKLIVSAKDGAVRWISGNSMSGAYQIDTPHAVITDEGTAFDLVVEPQQTLVLLHTGRVTVCAKGAPGRCKTLSRRGEMVLATTDDVVGPWESGLEPSGFETQCLNAKCAIAAFVAPPQPPSDGGRKGPERPPEPRHAVMPSQPETGEPPSRPEKRDTTVPSGPQIREVVVPSGPQIPPQIPEVAGGLRNLWLYVQPGQPDPNVKKYPPPYDPNDKTHQGSPTDPNVNKHQGPPTDTNVKKHQGSSIDTNATTYRCGDCGNQGSSTDTNVKKYQGSSIDTNLAKHPDLRSSIDTNLAKHPDLRSSIDTNLAKHPDLPNLTRHPDLPNLTMHSGPPNPMMRSGPPNLMMRSGPPNLMMRSGPPNLMMRSGPPQLHLPGGLFRRFGGPR